MPKLFPAGGTRINLQVNSDAALTYCKNSINRAAHLEKSDPKYLNLGS